MRTIRLEGEALRLAKAYDERMQELQRQQEEATSEFFAALHGRLGTDPSAQHWHLDADHPDHMFLVGFSDEEYPRCDDGDDAEAREALELAPLHLN